VNIDRPDLPPHRRMFERRVGNQRDRLAWLGVANATAARLRRWRRTDGAGWRDRLRRCCEQRRAGWDRSRARAVCSCGGQTCCPVSVR
jgi:hypothetical protein